MRRVTGGHESGIVAPGKPQESLVISSIWGGQPRSPGMLHPPPSLEEPRREGAMHQVPAVDWTCADQDGYAPLRGLAQGLLEAVPDAILISDRTGRIVLVNGRTEV